MMKFFERLMVLAVIALSVSVPVWAQHSCGTPDWDAYYSRLSPEERAMYDLLTSQTQQQLAKTNDITDPRWLRFQYDTAKFIIPTVVHVVFDNNSGTPDSVPAHIIEAAINAMNRDFRHIPGSLGNGSKGVDTQIHFSLATKDPNGQPTTGIIYHKDPTLSIQNSTSETVTTNEDFTMKNTYHWPTAKYFNIYIVTDINISGQDILGYARFPTFVATVDDGVVIQYSNFGGNDEYGSGRSWGRTGTHEAGHYMQLLHTFQSGCTGGDGVSDTPPETAAVFGSCNTRYNRCNNDNPDLAENNKNYMGYLDDLHANHYTLGQKTRMQTMLQDARYVQRYPLWQENNLMATGTGKYKKPQARFVASHYMTCPGQPVTFYDYSDGQPATFAWSFPTGADKQSSDERTPTVTFSTPGPHNVTLTVSNQTGTDDTTMTAVILVVDHMGSIPYSKNFESGEVRDYYIVSYDSTDRVDAPDTRWGRTALAGAPSVGNASMRMRHSLYCEYGARDAILMPTFDLSNTGQTNASVSFAWSYVPRQFGDTDNRYLVYNDTLHMQVSKDCGETWETLHYLGGEDLSSTGQPFITSDHTPTANSWMRDTISLNNYLGESSVWVKFEMINGFGNDFFLDQIGVDFIAGNPGTQKPNGTTSGRNRKPELQNIYLQPNPSHGHTHLHLQLATAQQVEVQVLDVRGASVYATSQKVAAGSAEVELPLNDLPAGFYLVRTLTAEGSKTLRFIKQ